MAGLVYVHQNVTLHGAWTIYHLVRGGGFNHAKIVVVFSSQIHLIAKIP